MDTSAHRRLAEALRTLHQGPILLLPNAWDAMSAAVLEQAGFLALATTSAGVAWSLGYGDGEKIPWHELVIATERVVRAVRVPVTADIEGGFSSTPSDLIHRTEEVIGAGVCGVNIEDGLGHGAPLRALEDAAARVAAVRSAATRMGIPIVINARTDVYLNAGNNDASLFDETVARCRAYFAAGADCVYPLGLVDLAQIAKLAATLKRPVNIIGRRGTPSLRELEAAGVARVSMATTLVLHAAGAVVESMAKLKQTGTFDHFTTAFDYGRMQGMFAQTRR